ncbi:MAG: hypothetical protein Kow0042_18200 [Calditrichia bacterium]
MNRRVQIWIISLMILMVAHTSWAQEGNRIREIERQLQRLEEKIREARQFVQLFQNPELEEIVRAAEKQHALAREAFDQQKYGIAAAHIKLGFAALKKLYQVIRNSAFIRFKFKEKLDQKIQESEQIVAQFPQADAWKLLNRARYFRQRAFQFAGEGKAEIALRHYFMALFFADKAIQVATGQVDDRMKDLGRYFEDTRNLLQQCQEIAATIPKPLVQNLLQKIQRDFQEAQRLYENNQNIQAHQKLQLVNRMLYRLLDLIEKTPASVAERLASDIFTLEEELNLFQGETDLSADPKLQRLYERILFLTTSARTKYEDGDYKFARQQIALANRLFLQLRRQSEGRVSTTQSQVENQLRTAEVMLNALQQQKYDDPNYLQLLKMLEQIFEDARRAFQANNLNLAVQNIKIFNRISVNLDRMRTEEILENQNELQAESSLERLKQLLNEMSASEGTEEDQIKYRNAEKLYQIASRACENQNYRLCRQLTRLAIHLLTQ